MKVVTSEREFVGPDLPVPLSPLRGLPEAIRRHLFGLRGPGFSRARLVNAAWAVGTGAAVLASLLLPVPWRGVAVVCAVLLGLYLVVRTFALVAFERRQYAFEPQWLAAQTEVLRGHAFDVLRFTVHALSGASAGRRTYDLTRPGDVAELLRRQERERASGVFSRVTVEFAYWLGAGETLAVGEVSRDLSEVDFLRGRAGAARAWIRFPQARYVGRPATGRDPAQQTRWALSGRVVVAVAEAVYGTAGGPAGATGLGSAR